MEVQHYATLYEFLDELQVDYTTIEIKQASGKKYLLRIDEFDLIISEESAVNFLLNDSRVINQTKLTPEELFELKMKY